MTKRPAPSAPPRPILLAVVNDLHAGSTVALCPPVVTLDDGGEYRASKVQLWLWQCWGEYWRRVAERRDELGADLYVILNGDLVDGDHHKTTQIMSSNPNAQALALKAALEVPLALKPDRVFVVRGTDAHVGQSGSTEESIARGLRSDKRPVVPDPETGTASWFHLRMLVNGHRVDVAHHGRTGQRAHTRAGAASLHAHDILMEHVKAGDPYPALCLRAHYHRFNDSHDACPVRVVTVGAWQLGTSYVHAKCTDSLADVGGAIVVLKEGAKAPEVEKVQFKVSRGEAWTPS